MRVHPVTWVARLAWLSLPFTIGTAIGDASASRSAAVQWTIAALAWFGWALGAVSLAVNHPLTLTGLRVLTPGAVAAGAWAAVVGGGVAGWIGVGAATVAMVAATSAWVADEHIDGTSYGDERRFALRAPGPLLLTAVPLAVTVVIVGVAAGPILLAARQWVLGVVVTLVGWTLAWLAVRSLHSLSLRFVVFVPAGMTIVDPSTITDAVLIARASVLELGPAPLESDRVDLSQQALGLALEVVCAQPIDLTIRVGRAEAEERRTRRVAFTPARPAAVLAEAARRRVGR